MDTTVEVEMPEVPAVSDMMDLVVAFNIIAFVFLDLCCIYCL
jgi:hypothetical protein